MTYISPSNFLRPQAEPEITFRMGKDFEPGRVYTKEEILKGVQSVIPSIEIIDTRFTNAPDVFSAIADNANSGGLVLAATEQNLASVDTYADIKVRLIVDDVDVGEGSTQNVMGNPIHSLVWLVNALSARKVPITRFVDGCIF